MDGLNEDGTCQNFVLEREPHQMQQGLALSRRENVGTIYPLPILNSSTVGATFVRGFVHSFTFLASRTSDYDGRGLGRLRRHSTDVKSAVGINTEAVQETLGPTHGLEDVKVLGVDEGGEVVRPEGEGGGVDVLILGEVEFHGLVLLVIPPSLLLWCPLSVLFPNLLALVFPLLGVANVRSRANVCWRGRTERFDSGSGGGSYLRSGGIKLGESG